jgi:hypothetical protein
MNFRKNSTLIIGLGSAVVLLGIALYFLIANHSKYNESQAALTSAKNRLTSLNNRNPFPSRQNIEETETHIDAIRTNYTAIMNVLQQGQLTSEPIEPARFAQLLEVATLRIRKIAETEGVVLPVDPGLGFKDYVAGKLPPNVPAVMDRLVIQIKAIEHIVSLMINAKVASIDSLQRDQFENNPAAVAGAEGMNPGAPGGNVDADMTSRRSRGVTSGRDPVSDARTAFGGVPPAATSPLYTTERFTIEFTARESAVWDVLNRFASDKATFVVVDLNMASTVTDLGKPVDLKAKLASMAATTLRPVGSSMSAQAAPQITLDSLSREERVVGGREPIKVKLVIDMYRFIEEAGGGIAP